MAGDDPNHWGEEEMNGLLHAKSLCVLVLLVSCSSQRDLGNLSDGGAGATGSAGTGVGTAGQGGGGQAGKGGGTAGTTGGSGGTAGAGGQAGAGGAPGVPLGVQLTHNPSVAGQVILTVLNLQTGARGPTAAFNPPASGWSAFDAKIWPDGQVRLLWSPDGGGGGLPGNGLIYRLDPSLNQVDSLTYTNLPAMAVAYARHPDGTARLLLSSNQMVRLDTSEQVDTAAPLIAVPGSTIHSYTMAPDGTSRIVMTDPGSVMPLIVTLNAADQMTAATWHAGNVVTSSAGNQNWQLLDYQVERSGSVHILWNLPDPGRQNVLLQTVLCSYPNEDATKTFPAQPEAGLPPCEQEPTALFMYTSLP
jgi:hypothetical protein